MSEDHQRACVVHSKSAEARHGLRAIESVPRGMKPKVGGR